MKLKEISRELPNDVNPTSGPRIRPVNPLSDPQRKDIRGYRVR